MSNTSSHAIQAASPVVQTLICISVDTAACIAFSQSNPGQLLPGGLYMVDNQLANNSANEGGLELSTRCNPGDRIGFYVTPIDPTQGDTVAFTGFNISQGSVFGSTGYPQQTSTSGDFWTGRAVAAGSTTYQPQIVITDSDGNQYPVQWDPFISDQS